MKTIIINGDSWSKNVDLINSIGLITAYTLIYSMEFHIETITDIKTVLQIQINEYKKRLDDLNAKYPTIQDMEEYIYYRYEGYAENLSCYSMDLEKLN